MRSSIDFVSCIRATVNVICRSVFVDSYSSLKIEVVRRGFYLTVGQTIIFCNYYITEDIDIGFIASPCIARVAHKHAAAVAVHFFCRTASIINCRVILNGNVRRATCSV